LTREAWAQSSSASSRRVRTAKAALSRALLVIRGEINELFVAGPPWRLTLLVRFDDRAIRDNGQEMYRNRTVLLVRTRWGRVVHQEDFYEDTERITALETRLRELGLAAVS
jgi:ketosteroid isomerase-like protein